MKVIGQAVLCSPASLRARGQVIRQILIEILEETQLRTTPLAAITARLDRSGDYSCPAQLCIDYALTQPRMWPEPADMGLVNT